MYPFNVGFDSSSIVLTTSNVLVSTTTAFASSDPKKKLCFPSAVNSSQTARKSTGMLLMTDRVVRSMNLIEKPFPVATAGGPRWWYSAPWWPAHSTDAVLLSGQIVTMNGPLPSPVAAVPRTFHVFGSIIVIRSESMSGSQQYCPSALTIMSQGWAPTLMVATSSNVFVSYTWSRFSLETGTTANLPSGVRPGVWTTLWPRLIVLTLLRVLGSVT